ncbi:hypothetical protein [Paenibacillus sp. FSL H8-0537]|uniref:hypothetical protein n=1 Tax=Paenibacillus sp. FSL H8-0537 TaxID=2921399 RepID=UPI0031016697
MELKLEATFEQTARITEVVTTTIVDRLDTHRNMIAKLEEEIEILKVVTNNRLTCKRRGGRLPSSSFIA